MLEIGQRVDGRYLVEELIGRGGLAEVYKVRHAELGSYMALKLLVHPHPELAERFVLEGRIQAQLRHPNVVAVTDMIRHDGKIGLLMEYVDHFSLEELLNRNGRLSVGVALELFASILAGVHAAHLAGVLHRDLKPANVLIARTPRGFVPKVSDFGIAKVLADGLDSNTREGISLGTPGYMAPEQVVDARSVDARTDVFALGAILYELLTGRRAFADESGEISLRATLKASVVPIDELAPGVPVSVQAAVLRALSKDRQDRFEDVASFARAVLAERPDLLGPFVPGAAIPSVSLTLSGADLELGSFDSSGACNMSKAEETYSDSESPSPSPQSKTPSSFWVSLGVVAALVLGAAGVGVLVAGPGLGVLGMEAELSVDPAHQGGLPLGAEEPAIRAAEPGAAARAVPTLRSGEVYAGQVDGRPLSLHITEVAGAEVRAEVQEGPEGERTTRVLSGSIEPARGRVSLHEIEGEGLLEGVVTSVGLKGIWGPGGGKSAEAIDLERE